MARSNNNNKLKAFVRFDGSGRIVPSSLIVQAFKPKVGNYKEIDAKEEKYELDSKGKSIIQSIKDEFKE